MKNLIKTPVTLGMKLAREDGERHNACFIYDAEGTAIASVYGIPQHTTVEELEAGVKADPNYRWAEGLKVGQFIVDAINKAGKV